MHVELKKWIYHRDENNKISIESPETLNFLMDRVQAALAQEGVSVEFEIKD